MCIHLHFVPHHPLYFPVPVLFPGLYSVPRFLCHHKEYHSTDEHIRLKPTLDPWSYLLPGPPVFRCDCITHPRRHWSKKTYLCSILKKQSFVFAAAQRAVSLFSLTEPLVGGPDMRPVISPVQFHTPQTPRTTPTFSG